ncbi:MAG: pitrilysin family protein [Thermodesulfobacteriota bacterium]|nr:pitrilysin family protein [Thermodesulfobacteriota bacterium]
MSKKTVSSGSAFARRIVLPNGTVVLLKEVKALPLVYMHLVIEAGSLLDPGGREGLAALTAEGLLTGTRRRTAARISEEIEFTGGALAVQPRKDYTSITLNVLKKALPTGLEILSDVLTQPAFRPKEIAKKKEEFKARIHKEEEDPGTLANKTFLAELFNKRLYGQPLLGTEKSISGLTKNDLMSFYQERLSHSRVICAVVGQITEREFMPLWERYLGPWPETGIETPINIPSDSKGGSGRIKKIDRDLTQANIVLGHRGIPRSHPDYYAVFVMNYILGGGGFRSRLMDNIREEKGLAYSIYSAFVSGRHAGYFQAVVETRNATAGVAIDEILKEMEQIRVNGVSDEELNEARLYLTGSFPLKMDTNAKIAGLLTDMEFYNLGLDYPARYPAIINAVSKDQVADAARKYLYPENYTLVIVGRQKEIKWPQ